MVHIIKNNKEDKKYRITNNKGDLKISPKNFQLNKCMKYLKDILKGYFR